MCTLFIVFVLFNLSFAGLFGKHTQLCSTVYLFTLITFYTVIIFNQENLGNIDFFIFNLIKQILTFSIYKKIKVSFVVFLALIPLLGFNINSIINSIVGKFADSYLLFLISVFNQNKVPDKFIRLTTFFGSFVGRQISIYLELSLIKACLLMFCCGFLTCFIIYGILTGFFVLGIYYAESWGNAVFNYLLKKASPSVKQKFKPKQY